MPPVSLKPIPRPVQCAAIVLLLCKVCAACMLAALIVHEHIQIKICCQ